MIGRTSGKIVHPSFPRFEPFSSTVTTNLHGYGIMQEVARQSDGRYKLGPGTLYDNLQRLMKQSLVEEVSGRPEEENSRRRYYRLSSLGRGVLSAEIARLEGVVRQARLHLKSPQPRRA